MDAAVLLLRAQALLEIAFREVARAETEREGEGKDEAARDDRERRHENRPGHAEVVQCHGHEEDEDRDVDEASARACPGQAGVDGGQENAPARPVSYTHLRA